MQVGDIYKFHYNADESQRLGFSATHCFEGMLHARHCGDSLVLIDTYWGIAGDGRSFTVEEAERKGVLTFYCNLNNVEPIKNYEQAYYADGDLFTISEQHACVPRCVHWFKRKGATRNAEKMLQTISERVKERERKIRSATDDLKRFAELQQQVQQGNLEIYL